MNPVQGMLFDNNDMARLASLLGAPEPKVAYYELTAGGGPSLFDFSDKTGKRLVDFAMLDANFEILNPADEIMTFHAGPVSLATASDRIKLMGVLYNNIPAKAAFSTRCNSTQLYAELNNGSNAAHLLVFYLD